MIVRDVLELSEIRDIVRDIQRHGTLTKEMLQRVPPALLAHPETKETIIQLFLSVARSVGVRRVEGAAQSTTRAQSPAPVKSERVKTQKEEPQPKKRGRRKRVESESRTDVITEETEGRIRQPEEDVVLETNSRVRERSARLSIDDPDVFTQLHETDRWVGLNIEKISVSEQENAGAVVSNGTEFFSIEDQYFADMRKYPLLTLGEERALWREIERVRALVRRALCMSPGAFATVVSLLDQAVSGEVDPQTIFKKEQDFFASGDEDEAADSADEAIDLVKKRCRDAMISLQKSMAHVRAFEKKCKEARGSSRQRRTSHSDRRVLWQAWIATWEEQQFSQEVYRLLETKLEEELHNKREHPSVRSAYVAWHRALGKLAALRLHMLLSNTRLVPYVYKIYFGGNRHFSDLVQEGNIGLMRAFDLFEPQRGVKFASYAIWWIRQAMYRSLQQTGAEIRWPTHAIGWRNKVRRAQHAFIDLHGREPTEEELSETLGISIKQIQQIFCAGVVATSLQNIVSGRDGERAFDYFVEDEKAIDPSETFEEEELKVKIANSLSTLSPKEATILRFRFGLDDNTPHTLEEVGQIFGVSRERIRQLEKIALEKLRHPQRSASLKDFVT